jgi:putative ABC transport system permease protein
VSSLSQAAFLAWKDYWHERLLSACSVLSLAATLTPLLVLLGVHYGIITALTDKLLQDPRTLEVSPVGSGKYAPSWFTELREHPGVAFVVPQTRSIAATITLRSGAGADARQLNTSLIATASGDPLLSRFGVQAPGFPDSFIPSGGSEKDSGGTDTAGAYQSDRLPGIVLSSATAQRLGINAGQAVTGYLERSRSGRRESETVSLMVEALLPPEAQDADASFVPLALLVALEDYRDGKAVPFFGWTGDTYDDPSGGGPLPGSPMPGTAPDPWQRVYSSFRLYATDMDQVEPLRQFFLGKHLEVYVRSAEIETVQSLDRAFTVVFALITGATVFGFAAATASSSLAGVKRKSRSLGIIRLMGFSRSSMVLFPLLQSLFTAMFGFLLALGLYAVVALSINSLFAASVPDGAPVCTLPLHYGMVVFTAVLGLSALSSSSAALQVTAIEPSEVIRDV